MIAREEAIEIGQYNKTHGIKGEISASFLCDADEIQGFSTLISCVDGIFVPFFIEQCRPKNDHTVLIKLEGVDDEKKAKPFVNRRIYVLRKEFTESDEVYCDYFIGYEILDSLGKRIGRIAGIDDSTENVLFEVDCDGGTALIPVTEDFILEIREDEKLIVMDLPEGMISAQLG